MRCKNSRIPDSRCEMDKVYCGLSLTPPSTLVAQDAGDIVRRAEAALLTRISSDFSFPSGDSAVILPLLAEHLKLKLSEEDPKAWGAVEAVFKRAHPWAVSHDAGGAANLFIPS